ncbi:hypothetical protein [Muricoccus vinaceus]|uniref:Uncharacterized protein n=1 Tax=Muricoccus vinaceus TaxID=424704 RepID=A0ABV6J0T1_9PROT
MSRRNLLSGIAAMSIGPAAVLATHATAATLNRRSAPDPDAELIRICEAHPSIIAAVNDYGSGEDDCPLWQAYERSRDAIHAAVPVTLAGMVAKARAARAEALNPKNGTVSPSGTPAEIWAWDLVQHLLRLEG